MSMEERLALLQQLREARERVDELEMWKRGQEARAAAETATPSSRQLQAQLDVLQQSRAYRLGRILVDSARRPVLLLQWPGMAWRILRRRLNADLTISAPAVPVVPAALLAEPIKSDPIGAHLAGEITVLDAADALPQDASELRLALVCDQFTTDSLALECATVSLHPEKWKSQISSFRPNLLLVESAWVGLEGEWRGKVTPAGPDICALVMSCRRAGIPTIFWNKEDPLHFEAFIEVASLFDHVLTTDADSVPKYIAKLGHSRVGVLPFAVQPKLHHPFSQPGEQRQEASFFAGAWYGNLTERCRDFSRLANALALAGPFRIYDRNAGQKDAGRQYPEQFSKYVNPAVPYELTPALYRSFRIGLTLNTIKDSPTMFARRALELICTNTSVYSNYSRALALLLGDLVRATDDGKAVLEWAWSELQDPEAPQYLDRRLRAMRKVLAEHTWANRLDALLAIVRGGPLSARRSRVVVLCNVQNSSQAERISQMAARQHAVDLEVWAVSPDESPLPANMKRLSAQQLELGVAQVFPGLPVSVWSTSDYYGPHYLQDLLLALSFQQGEIVGKACFMRREGQRCEWVGLGLEYSHVHQLAWRRALAPAHCWVGTLGSILANAEIGAFDGVTAASTDRQSYCQSMDDCDVTCGTESTHDGASMADVDDLLSRMIVGESAAKSGAWVPGSTLADLFDKNALPARTSIVAHNGAMELVSKLSPGEDAALFSRNFSAAELFNESETVNLRLDAEQSPAFDVYLDAVDVASGDIVDRLRIFPGTTHALRRFKESADAVFRLAIALHGPYVGHWQGMSVGNNLSVPMVMPGRGRLLVVVNGYPRRGDLYRNAFVHRRVKLYQAQGVGVDVVWVSTQVARQSYEHEGVQVLVCDAPALRATLRYSGHAAIAVHFLDADLWESVREAAEETPTVVWIHGAEIQSWTRRMCTLETDEAVVQAKRLSAARTGFWREIFLNPPRKLMLVFVSNTLARESAQDIGMAPPDGRWAVVHNPIDVETFAFREKSAEKRFHILSIRPHASAIYANDLVAAVIERLSVEPEFRSMHFTLVGDGPLWEKNFSALEGYSNVELRRGFLNHGEIAELHRRHGIFLVPSRADTQGVSRDEAMASGLVPITSRIDAIQEFVDDDCGILCPAEDVESLAQACLALIRDPGRFQRLSANAAGRVRRQSSSDVVVGQELALLQISGALRSAGNQTLRADA